VMDVNQTKYIHNSHNRTSNIPLIIKVSSF
jgi:hypothetical protein